MCGWCKVYFHIWKISLTLVQNFEPKLGVCFCGTQIPSSRKYGNIMHERKALHIKLITE